MKLAALTGGGKDSLYAMYLLSKSNEIKYMLTLVPERKDSYMFHYPNVLLTKQQADAMGIPLRTIRTPGRKEEELDDLVALIKLVRSEIDGIVTGAIASEYQKSRVEKICSTLGLKCISPLWHIDTEAYWKDLLDAGFEVVITSVSAEGLDDSWLGRKIDFSALEELKKLSKKHRFHLAFEGGEAETFVTNMPLFRKPIRIKRARKEWDGKAGMYIIEDVV